MTEVRLYMFQCGVLRQHWHLAMNQPLPEPNDVPVPWFVITHPKGHTIVDGGNPAVCAVDARRHWGGVVDRSTPIMKPDEACLEQLRRAGIEAADVRYVVQTHLHLDHTGAMTGLNQLPNATVLATRAEYEYAHAPDWFMEFAYIRADYEDRSIPWRLLEPSDDGYDVYGDGTIRLWQTPGHSPGHQSVEVRLSNSGSILITGDAVATMENWHEREILGIATSHVKAARSIRKLRRLAERADSAIVPGHDAGAWAAFRHAPEFYT